ncbi:MAG: UbiD family decarboxylase [Chloroflexi bacterium]|nr:UbiD family decarboxylase [Chloroflexota bacterium]
MSYNDLREWLARVDEFGELRHVDGMELGLDIGTLYELSWEKKSLPTIVFDKIKGFPAGYRIVTTAQSPRVTGLTLGLPYGDNVMKLTQGMREKLRADKRVAPKLVETGPILENVHLGDDVNLHEFPVPTWHELDGGPYIGTGCAVITRDPDEGWVNLGTYRVQLHDKNTLGFYISPGKHGRIHREKYYARGEPCPVAISFGQDPLLFTVASAQVPWGVSEYEIAGGFTGEPVEVVRGPVTGLPIPANAEIVIEGESYPSETRMEGPFGEFTGYYGSGEREEPLIRVKSVLHRNEPILFGVPPMKPGGAAGASQQVICAAVVWNGLERTGVPGIMGVCVYQAWFMMVVSMRQQYPGHSKQVAALAGQLPGAAYCGRWVVVVDEDIDPTNFSDVMWALSSRCDPAISLDILHRTWSSPLDPMSNSGLLEGGPRVFNSRVIVDCCIPYELKTRKLFPAVVGASREDKARVDAAWGALIE